MTTSELAQDILDFIEAPGVFISDDPAVKNWVKKVEQLCDDIIILEGE